MKLIRMRRGLTVIPSAISEACLSVCFPLSPSIHWFIYSLYVDNRTQLDTVAVTGGELQRQEVRMCSLSSLTCCVHMECVDRKESCFHCLFIYVQILWGTLCVFNVCLMYSNSLVPQ